MSEVYDDLEQHYKHRLAGLAAHGETSGDPHAGHYARYLDVSRTLLEVERQAALRLRNDGKLTDEALREMERELDLNETRLNVAAERR
jgi:CPA1 family monovalent cation:H+ antiporter